MDLGIGFWFDLFYVIGDFESLFIGKFDIGIVSVFNVVFSKISFVDI